MTGIPAPIMPVPARVLALEARFAAGRGAALGGSVDADVFQTRLDRANAASTQSAADVGGPVATQIPVAGTPSVNPQFSGRVVNDDGTLAADVPYADLFRSAGAAHGIPPSILAAVAKAESAFDPNALSHAGAQGLMQFMPATAEDMGVDPHDPASAIDGAARYLSQNLRRFGSMELALAAYNAGPGNVQRHDGIPPFAETQAYVPKVLAYAGMDTTGASS